MKRLGKYDVRLLALLLAVAVVFTTVIPANMTVNAATESNTKAAAATPGDADGFYTAEDGCLYYYAGGQILKKTGWVKVSDSLKIKLDKKYRVEFTASVKNKKTFIKKNNGENKGLVTYTKNVVVLEDKKLHYTGADGAVVTTAGKASDGKGTTYYLSKNGVVTSKLVRNGDSIRYYTYSADKWNAVKGKYKTLDGVLYYFSPANGIASKMYKNNTKQLYRYSSSKLRLVKRDIATVSGNKLYYFNSSGQRITKAGWYILASGTRVYVSRYGYVTAKMTLNGKTRKYYSYDYKSLKWVSKKNTWVTVNNVDYYFAGSGKAVYTYNTKSGRFSQYKNGKWVSSKNSIHTLKNGKIYFVNSKSVITKKAGWYDTGSKEKVCVNSKGYVTMKFSGKAGKLYKYNYSRKRWELVKVTSYKIGKKTYYFDSNGVVAKNKIVGNKKSGYFYVDKTGCRVDQREIQMAVDFVMANTNSSMTTDQKMYRCFHILSDYPYMRDYVVPTDINRFYDYAADTFTLKQANCYRYSSAFACVATVLGYEARVCCGEVPNIYDTGMTIHGWTELWSDKDKEWKVYDVRMHHNFPDRNYYNVYMKDYYPNRCIQGSRARLKVRNGKVNWSWLSNSELNDH